MRILYFTMSRQGMKVATNLFVSPLLLYLLIVRSVGSAWDGKGINQSMGDGMIPWDESAMECGLVSLIYLGGWMHGFSQVVRYEIQSIN